MISNLWKENRPDPLPAMDMGHTVFKLRKCHLRQVKNVSEHRSKSQIKHKPYVNEAQKWEWGLGCLFLTLTICVLYWKFASYQIVRTFFLRCSITNTKRLNKLQKLETRNKCDNKTTKVAQKQEHCENTLLPTILLSKSWTTTKNRFLVLSAVKGRRYCRCQWNSNCTSILPHLAPMMHHSM